MHRLLLLRHGESIWNKENRFTGWTDVGLTDGGMQEAVQAGRLMLREGYRGPSQCGLYADPYQPVDGNFAKKIDPPDSRCG